MIKERYPGYGRLGEDMGIGFDETGQQTMFSGTQPVNRAVHQPIMVNDQRFQPFGDPNQPPEVRRQRLQAMLAGGQSGSSVSEFSQKVNSLRDLARMHQQFQPHLLDPRDSNAIDQLGPQLFTQPFLKDAYYYPQSDFAQQAQQFIEPHNERMFKSVVDAKISE